MIPAPDVVTTMLDALNDLGARYLITGSIASNAYGEPRGTIDADFVLEVTGDEIRRLRERLGDAFMLEDQMRFETVTGKVQHRFRHAESKFLVEVFEASGDDPHEQARFERRRMLRFLDRPAFYPTAEDVVVQKLRWLKRIGRVKDRNDIVNVLDHQWNVLDWAYVERWCGEHGTSELLNELREEARAIREG
jgi:hypothetical protein